MDIPRSTYLDKLIRHQGNNLIKIITGCRRCGKSYLLFKQFRDYLKNTGVDDSHLIMVALDDRANKELREPDKMLGFIKGKISDSKTYYVMLDEIQLLSEFEDVLNSLLHIENLDVYVTGSNSHLLSSDVVTTFRGRGDEIRIHPLSFKEFTTAFPGNAIEAWDKYLLYGGMPLTMAFETDEDKSNYLEGLFESIYMSDIQERYKVRNKEELDDILNILASSIGSLTNPLKLSKTFKSVKNKTISDNTIRKYISYFEDAFLLNKALRYDIKGKKYINTPSKFYFEDVGLRNAKIGFRQTEETHIMENILYNELKIKGYKVDVGVVGKDDLEIDFVATKGAERLYVQSALNIDSPEKREQEIRPLTKVADSFKKIVVIKGYATPRIDENGIETEGIINFCLA